MTVRKRVKLETPALIFVTTTVKDHIGIFKNHKFAKITLGQFVETCRHFNISIVGYVLMPSHLHAMIGLKNASKLSEFMQAFKSLSSRKIKDALNVSQRKMFSNENGGFNLWKRGFDDTFITSQSQFRIKLNYIHNNPIKAGLVSSPEEYNYSSAIDWFTDRSGLVKIDKGFKWLEE